MTPEPKDTYVHLI